MADEQDIPLRLRKDVTLSRDALRAVYREIAGSDDLMLSRTAMTRLAVLEGQDQQQAPKA